MSGRISTGNLLLIVALSLLMPAIVYAEPTTREYPSLYKSTRAMGMGGAYTAVGGRVDALFYNPAGLINIPQDKGWEVNLLNVSAEYGENTRSFMDDYQDAIDTGDLNNDGSTDDDQLRAVNDVLEKHQGENMHARVADFTSIGKSYDRWAFGVGGIVNGRIDAIAHQGFGADGFLEVNADATYGALGGVSYGLSEKVFVGLTLKALNRESLVHNFSSRELVEKQDTLDDYIKDELAVNGNAFGVDAGLIWKFYQDSSLKPSFGASVMNIGNLNFDAAGKIPQSVNVGFAINPSFSKTRSLLVGLDYIDVLNNFKQDKDVAKRIRFGAELQLFDAQLVELALRAGMYESSPTLGFDLRLLVFTVSYAMYTEEIGAYAGQDKDRRQLLTVNIGW